MRWLSSRLKWNAENLQLSKPPWSLRPEQMYIVEFIAFVVCFNCEYENIFQIIYPSSRVALSSSPWPVDQGPLPHLFCVVELGFFPVERWIPLYNVLMDLPVKNVGSIALGNFITKLSQQEVLQQGLIVPRKRNLENYIIYEYWATNLPLR